MCASVVTSSFMRVLRYTKRRIIGGNLISLPFCVLLTRAILTMHVFLNSLRSSTVHVSLGSRIVESSSLFFESYGYLKHGEGIHLVI